MARGEKLKRIFFGKENYDTLLSTMWIIPILIGVNKYQLKDKAGSGFLFTAYSLQILIFFEFRFLLLGTEEGRARRARRKRQQPKPRTFALTIYRSPDTGKCMFIRNDRMDEKYWDTLDGFEMVETLYATTEDEMIKKLKEYQVKTNTIVIPIR